jgi:xanthine dehydrogenase YagS FAD-binding subunit
MRPVSYERAGDVQAALGALSAAPDANPLLADAQFVAGGTTLLDLAKLQAMTPARLIDISRLPGRIERRDDGLWLGGSVRMSVAATNEDVQRDFPALAQSLLLAASPQLRNMATLAGNVLQRTRCPYFRDVSYTACNKRDPGSGCAALDGFNRQHAVLGVGESCIAAYPGDFAQALIALDARVEIVGSGGTRTIAFADLHTDPERDPQRETQLAGGEIIAGFFVPDAPAARRSLFLKIRDRQSYAFALASAAVALELDGDLARDIRIALGGLAGRPWRARAAESLLRGKRLDPQTIADAAEAEFASARPHQHNAFKVDLGRRVLARAVTEAAELEV